MELIELVQLIMLIVSLAALIFIVRQTRLIEKQIFGEVYPKPVIRGLEFYMPKGREQVVNYFSETQKADKEISIGREIEIPKKKEVELHIRFWLDAPQRLKMITFGFLDRSGERVFEGHPVVVKNT